MLFEAKTYRNSFSAERFRSFGTGGTQPDFWVGVDPSGFCPELPDEAGKIVNKLRQVVESYIASDPFFKKSLKPCPLQPEAPAMIAEMGAAGELAAVGPMAALNAAMAEKLGLALAEKFNLGEIVVECGGDLFVKVREPLNVPVLAGDSDISGLVGIEILPGQTPVTIATGAGTKGQPINHGKAEAILIVAKSGALAGAFAVGFGNLIKTPADVDKTLKRTEVIPEIEGAVLVFDDQIGLRGDFELKMLT